MGCGPVLPLIGASILMNAIPRANAPPQRQFNFVADGRLQDAPVVRQLARSLEPVTTYEFCQNVLNRFLGENTLYAVPVVDASAKPVALLDRRHYVEFFSKPYSREVFGRRSIAQLLAYTDYEGIAPIVVEGSCSVEDVAQIVMDADIQHMVTGVIVSSQGRYLGVANGHDLINVITKRKQADLYYLAHFDGLTGVPNRTLLRDRFEHACRDAERKGNLVGLLFIDIDRFKHINDSIGHSAGDALLREVVSRINASARRADTVARLSGDEFVVVMEGIASPADVDLVALRLVHSMRQPLELLGHNLVVTVSVGSAIYPTDDTSISNLLAKADAAMYESKVNGGDGYHKYSTHTAMGNPASLVMENELRQAIDDGELVLHYQPQVELASRDIRGVEALVRWHHPIRGMISPAQFIPLAEECGLIVQLGEWVLRQAFRQINSWQAQGVSPPPVAINISALQFRKRNFPQLLKALLAEYAIDPRLIGLELTESVLMHNAGEVQQILEEIKALGVSLAIDDFGTGFSSLSYLRRFPIDYLKIDQTFVRDIERTPVNESICRAMVALANSLSLGIIAEGIEKPTENAALEQMGCTKGQGYLFGKPMSADDIVVWFPKKVQNCPTPSNTRALSGEGHGQIHDEPAPPAHIST